MGPILSQLALHAWDLFALSWGLVSLMITFAITIIDGSFFRRRPKSATRDLAVGMEDTAHNVTTFTSELSTMYSTR